MVRSFEEIAEAARETRRKGAIKRASAGLVQDVRLERALKKSEKKKVLKKQKVLKKRAKFLKKPTAKGPTPVSATKTLSRFAATTGPVVREVEQKVIVQDNRSQFFRSELELERRGIDKWLG